MKKETIDLDFEFEKILASELEQAKNLKDESFENLKEKIYNLEILEKYMDLNEDIFEEIQDLLDITENRKWYEYSNALETIREILKSRIYLLDSITNPKSERDNDSLCL